MAANKFGDNYKVQYDVVIDHNAYEFLRVSIEVDRQISTKGTVFLNGKSIGQVDVLGKKQYKATRFPNTVIGEFKDLGKATAAVISDLV